MRCQICNRETENWEFNKSTNKYESICNVCKNAIRGTTYYYTDFEEDVIDADLSEEDLLTILEKS